jgi:hypothetical protein
MQADDAAARDFGNARRAGLKEDILQALALLGLALLLFELSFLVAVRHLPAFLLLAGALAWIISEYLARKGALSPFTACALATIFSVSIGSAFALVVIEQLGLERFAYWSRASGYADAPPVIAVGLALAAIAFQLRFRTLASMMIVVVLAPFAMLAGPFFGKAVMHGAEPYDGGFIPGIYAQMAIYALLLTTLVLTALADYHVRISRRMKAGVITATTLLSIPAYAICGVAGYAMSQALRLLIFGTS